jgi:histone deacetylase 11
MRKNENIPHFYQNNFSRRDAVDSTKNVMIIDLDAHQGNGYARDFMSDKNIFIFDIYNSEIYPMDYEAKRRIDLKIELPSWTNDETYISLVEENIIKAFDKFTPDIIYYNAGTDVLEKDPLGALDISPEGVIKRDEIVFNEAFKRKIPIVMLLSGGYQKSNYEVIAKSILNLKEKFAFVF